MYGISSGADFDSGADSGSGIESDSDSGFDIGVDSIADSDSGIGSGVVIGPGIEISSGIEITIGSEIRISSRIEIRSFRIEISPRISMTMEKCLDDKKNVTSKFGFLAPIYTIPETILIAEPTPIPNPDSIPE